MPLFDQLLRSRRWQHLGGATVAVVETAHRASRSADHWMYRTTSERL